jgi:glycerate kinase
MRGVSEGVLVAPDSFKGTFTAAEVAAAVARGLREGGVAAEELPLADGGEGTLEVLRGALGAELRHAEVCDPLGRPVRAAYGLAGELAIVESAAASGLGLVAEDERDAWRASTRGTGELLCAAVRDGAREVLLGAGGSATTDGGAGALEAIAEQGGLGRTRMIVLCDVRTPWERAAQVFAAQKGADADQVRELALRLDRLAAELPRDPRGLAMSGAAGGLAGGLWAAAGAQLVPGAEHVLRVVGFEDRMRAARAVLTGEGRLDEQSLSGKLLGEVATRARQAGVPCHAVVGRCDLDAFGLRLLDLGHVVQATTRAELEAAGRKLAASLRP